MSTCEGLAVLSSQARRAGPLPAAQAATKQPPGPAQAELMAHFQLFPCTPVAPTVTENTVMEKY